MTANTGNITIKVDTDEAILSRIETVIEATVDQCFKKWFRKYGIQRVDAGDEVTMPVTKKPRKEPKMVEEPPFFDEFCKIYFSESSNETDIVDSQTIVNKFKDFLKEKSQKCVVNKTLMKYLVPKYFEHSKYVTGNDHLVISAPEWSRLVGDAINMDDCTITDESGQETIKILGHFTYLRCNDGPCIIPVKRKRNAIDDVIDDTDAAADTKPKTPRSLSSMTEPVENTSGTEAEN